MHQRQICSRYILLLGNDFIFKPSVFIPKHQAFLLYLQRAHKYRLFARHLRLGLPQLCHLRPLTIHATRLLLCRLHCTRSCARGSLFARLLLVRIRFRPHSSQLCLARSQLLLQRALLVLALLLAGRRFLLVLSEALLLLFALTLLLTRSRCLCFPLQPGGLHLLRFCPLLLLLLEASLVGLSFLSCSQSLSSFTFDSNILLGNFLSLGNISSLF
mmetsp:Transcript_25530/g.43532  ORF Transcript_25530/g.43532 Transcript_25530/m.43532 type:complete len:215 (+) Transcript_25530:381-1025(+)